MSGTNWNTTPNYSLYKPITGKDDDLWGDHVNSNFDIIDNIMFANASGAKVTVGDTPPASPADGAMWFDSVGLQLYLRYNDGNSSQWIPTTNPGGGSGSSGATLAIGDTPPASPTAGALWWDSLGGNLYVYYTDQNTSQWVTASNLTGLANVATKADVAAASGPNVGRNFIHNSLFNIQQRGAGPWTTAQMTFDRWNALITLDVTTVSVGTADDNIRIAIGDEDARSYLIVNCNGNAGATAVTYMAQKVEGVRRLAGKTVTLSFWMRASSGTPKLGLNFAQDFGTGGSPSATIWGPAPVAVTTSNAWTRYSATFAVPSTTGKTLGTNGNDCTWIAIFSSSGANANALAGSIGVQAFTASIWGVQLEIGSGAAFPTALEKPDPGDDLRRCQRFFETSYAPGVAPGSTTNNNPSLVLQSGLTNGTNTTTVSVQFSVAKRAAPTVTYYSPVTGVAGKVRDYQNGADVNAVVVSAQASGMAWNATASTNSTQVNFGVNWTASADL